jgi:predicted transcriptional regulator
MTEEHFAYILVEEDKWWQRRCARNKTGNSVHSFVRRGKVGPKDACKLLFYIKLPARQIKGVGDFVERITGSKDELWNLYGSETVFGNNEEYQSFIQGRESVTMIRFKNLEELEKPIGFELLRAATGIRKMPNGGMYINKETLNQII